MSDIEEIAKIITPEHSELYLSSTSEAQWHSDVLHILTTLRTQLSDLNDYYADIMSTSCRGDEKHCTCVPALRKRVEELEEELEVRNAHIPLIQMDADHYLKALEGIVRRSNMTVDIDTKAMWKMILDMKYIATDAIRGEKLWNG